MLEAYNIGEIEFYTKIRIADGEYLYQIFVYI